MTSIFKAGKADVARLATIGRRTFVESHGHSAGPDVIQTYIDEKFTEAFFEGELQDPRNLYYIIAYNGKPAGYLKIIFDAAHANVPLQNATKLERLYLLKEFYGLKLGSELFQFAIAVCKQHRQNGMWLFVWKENNRAINFYRKMGFKIIGAYDFKLTPTHSNPNHQMLLVF